MTDVRDIESLNEEMNSDCLVHGIDPLRVRLVEAALRSLPWSEQDNLMFITDSCVDLADRIIRRLKATT